MSEILKITAKQLKKWGACLDGAAKFNELFPDGADLKTASDALISHEHADWANWLWIKCSETEEFKNQMAIAAGYLGTASAGYRGTASAGDLGTASAGYLGTASAGYRGTASAGYRGTASAGDLGTASAGYLGTASAGYLGTASAGDRGTAKTGKFGAMVIQYYDGENYRLRTGEVGPDGLKPETWYKLDDKHKFIEVPADEVEKLIAERDAERKNG